MHKLIFMHLHRAYGALASGYTKLALKVSIGIAFFLIFVLVAVDVQIYMLSNFTNLFCIFLPFTWSQMFSTI